jgi:competence protein ComGF
MRYAMNPQMSQTMKQLSKFAIDIRETDFVLRLTDDTGDVSEFATSVEQLDQVIDALNDLMASGDDD